MPNSSGETGELFVVATPIGNLDDITLRAIHVLRSVNIIAAEDTRHSSKLLSRHGISTPVLSYHEHNEQERTPRLISRMLRGDHIAIISDAGTPLITDPGYRLVCAALEVGVKVSPIPGPCAGIAALSASGLAVDRFAFEGFLPSKSSARRRRLAELHHESRSLVFYESAHRVLSCVKDMNECFGPDRMITIARELTKRYETFKRDTLANCLQWMLSDPQQQKGEFVLILQGGEKQSVGIPEPEAVLRCLLSELPLKRAATLTARITGRPKNELYKLGLSLAVNEKPKV